MKFHPVCLLQQVGSTSQVFTAVCLRKVFRPGFTGADLWKGRSVAARNRSGSKARYPHLRKSRRAGRPATWYQARNQFSLAEPSIIH